MGRLPARSRIILHSSGMGPPNGDHSGSPVGDGVYSLQNGMNSRMASSTSYGTGGTPIRNPPLFSAYVANGNKKKNVVGAKVDDYINHINAQISASQSESISSSSSSSVTESSIFLKEKHKLVRQRQSQQQRRFVPNDKSPTWMGLLEQRKSLLLHAIAHKSSEDLDDGGDNMKKNKSGTSSSSSFIKNNSNHYYDITLPPPPTAPANKHGDDPALPPSSKGSNSNGFDELTTTSSISTLNWSRLENTDGTIMDQRGGTVPRGEDSNRKVNTAVVELDESQDHTTNHVDRNVDDRTWHGAGNALLPSAKKSEGDVTTQTKTPKADNDSIDIGSGLAQKKAIGNNIVTITTSIVAVDAPAKKDELASYVERNMILASSSSESLIYSLGDTVDSGDHLEGTDDGDEGRMKKSLHNLAKAINNASEMLSNTDDDSSSKRSREGEVDVMPYDSPQVSTRSTGTAAISDLVESTLAECRLLLEMSPPSSPYAKRGFHHILSNLDECRMGSKDSLGVGRRRDEQRTAEKSSQPGERNDSGARREQIPPQQRCVPTSTNGAGSDNCDGVDHGHNLATSDQGVDTPHSFCSLSIDSMMATCPVCFKDFDMEDGDQQPLQSSTCEHIICRACVFDIQAWTDADKSTIIPCPECGQKGTFDINQSTSSLGSTGLLTRVNKWVKMETILSGESNTGINERVNSAITNEALVEYSIGMQHQPLGVPSQIGEQSPIAVKDQAAVVEDHNQQHGENASVSTSASERGAHKGREGEETANSILLEATVANEHHVPMTPMSRAELRILERRESLVQSLEMMNRILEQGRVARQRPNDHHVTTPTSRTMVPEEESVDVSNDEIQYNLANKPYRRMPILRVDTGDGASSPISLAVSQKTIVEPEADVCAAAYHMSGEVVTTSYMSVMSLFSPVKVSSTHKPLSRTTQRIENHALMLPSPLATKAATPITTSIFRTDNDFQKVANAPETIEFGYFAATMSHDSSLTDNNDDTRFLLADNHIKQSPKEEVSTDYHHRFSNVIGRLEQRITCSQFLPSLTYSTDQNCVACDNAISSSAKIGTVRTARPNRGRSGVCRPPIVFFKDFVSRPFGLGDISPRHAVFRNQDSHWGNTLDMKEKEKEKEEEMAYISGPTYEFSLHSCSMSPPPSDDGQFWPNNTKDGRGGDRVGDGSLVTHKPRRLHRKILNSLRIKKSRQSGG